MIKMFSSLLGNKRRLIIILVIVIALAAIIAGSFIKSSADSNANKAKADQELREHRGKANEKLDPKLYGTDQTLLRKQDSLNEKYGSAGEGFVWDYDGTLLPLGDPKMPADEVVFTFLRGVATLDFNTASRFSRKSYVVKQYQKYFDADAPATGYKDQFLRDAYREALMSLQVNRVDATSTFAGDQRTFTVSAKILDLTDKDFWRADEAKIMDNLYTYRQSETDSAKADIYLYDYVLNHYRNNAKLRDITFDITLRRYPEIQSGWLVSIDNDLNDTLKYNEGTLVVNFIKEQFTEYAADRKAREAEARRNN